MAVFSFRGMLANTNFCICMLMMGKFVAHADVPPDVAAIPARAPKQFCQCDISSLRTRPKSPPRPTQPTLGWMGVSGLDFECSC